MRLVISGEGPSDLGAMVPGVSGFIFSPGPVMQLLDCLCERWLNYFLLDLNMVTFIGEGDLKPIAKALSKGRNLRSPGKKRGKETAFYYRNAMALADHAKTEFANEEAVYPVLFRDSDGTNSTPRGDWVQKYQSMLDGFSAGGSDKGIAMLAKPKSEAWFLCALKPQPYEGCTVLESESGNDNSPNALKEQLEAQLGETPSAHTLNERIEQGYIDPQQIDMPSFNVIKARVNELLDTTGRP